MGAIKFVKKVHETNFPFARDGHIMSSIGIQTSAKTKRPNDGDTPSGSSGFVEPQVE